MANRKQPDETPRCGARTSSGQPCKAQAGKGTDHLGTGRCKHHGGASSGAPVGNKNAVSTGEYESILWDVLEADERELAAKVQMDKVKLLEEEIALITIRERRMLKRIADLGGAKMTLVEESTESSKDGRVTRRRRQGTLGQIQAIEDALTRVQSHKARLIELKHKFESGGDSNGSDDSLAALAQVIEESARQLHGGSDGVPV